MEKKLSFLFEPHTPFDFDSLDEVGAKRAFCEAIMDHQGNLEESMQEVASSIFQKYGGMIVIRFLSLICNTRNSPLTCKALAYASGISSQTLEEIASEEGISKQAVDKLAKDLGEDLNLPPSNAQRSEAVRESMSQLSRERRLNQTLESDHLLDE